MTTISNSGGACLTSHAIGLDDSYAQKPLKFYDLTIPEELPDPELTSAEELFNLMADYVRDFGSEEVKEAFDNEEKLVLRVIDEFGNIADVFVDIENGLADLVGAIQNPRDERTKTMEV